MGQELATGPARRPAAFAAAVALSLSALFAGTPLSSADPYDDDGGGGDDSSYVEDSGGGGDDGGADSGGVDDSGSDDGGGGDEPAPAPPGDSGDDTQGGGMGGGDEGGGMGGGDEGASTGGGDEGGGMGGGDEGASTGGGDEGGGMGGGDEGASTGGDDTQGGGMGGGDDTQGGGMDGGGGMLQPSNSQAPAADVTTANSAEVTTVTSTEATSEQISTYTESIQSSFTSSNYSTGGRLRSPVAAWNSRWVSYDRYYRPVFTNPYRSPLQVVYDYGSGPQTFTVPPLQRAAIDVPTAGVFNFTGMTNSGSGPASNVSVGSFSGGGYQPAPGQPPPNKPPVFKSIPKPLVQVSYSGGKSEPFRVSSLTDLGKDPTANGATKVLLDEEIPAWGEWVKSPKGDEQMFEITETQLLPGVKPPGQDPIPGYDVQLVTSSNSTSWIDRNKTVLVAVAAGAGVLALAAVVLILIRRRPSSEA
ncbi:MAG: hypothetical protein AB7G47_06770 [Mycolicibacterium sp.]|uniref:hypothetical protein n=1 Tax=Mycolicibacterium sp. TaxID=2320850 RepID=UPI003D0A77DF